MLVSKESRRVGLDASMVALLPVTDSGRATTLKLKSLVASSTAGLVAIPSVKFRLVLLTGNALDSSPLRKLAWSSEALGYWLALARDCQIFPHRGVRFDRLPPQVQRSGTWGYETRKEDEKRSGVQVYENFIQDFESYTLS